MNREDYSMLLAQERHDAATERGEDAPALTFTGTGIYPDVPEADYHARRFGPRESLSSTEAKRVLKAPALFRYHRDHGQDPRPEFDLGHVAHTLVLGVGLPVWVHDHDSLRTKAAREEVAEHRAAGEVPIVRDDWEAMTALADSVLTHPVAGPLFEAGTPEQSIYATDSATGVWMRGRVDWTTQSEGSPLLVDLKTTVSADPSEFSRSVVRYGYDLQAAWYRMIWAQATGRKPHFVHVLAEKKAPFLVSVVELDQDFLEVGEIHARSALDSYARCMASGDWPGYLATTHPLTPPTWYAEDAGLYDLEF